MHPDLPQYPDVGGHTIEQCINPGGWVDVYPPRQPGRTQWNHCVRPCPSTHDYILTMLMPTGADTVVPMCPPRPGAGPEPDTLGPLCPPRRPGRTQWAHCVRLGAGGGHAVSHCGRPGTGWSPGVGGGGGKRWYIKDASLPQQHLTIASNSLFGHDRPAAPASYCGCAALPWAVRKTFARCVRGQA